MKTLALHEQNFITDAKGRRVGVLVPLKTYERLCDAAEQLADVRAYDAARTRVQAEVESGRCATLASYRQSRKAK